MTAIATQQPAGALSPADKSDRVRSALALDPDGVIETIARTVGLTPRDVLETLPDGAARMVGSDRFGEVWQDLSTWGEVLFIVHTDDIVLECKGSLPEGTAARGWFNIHGDSPIGGHIRQDNCRAVVFVDRAFHGRRSCSVWFLNGAGAAMFKVFVPRDESRSLKAPQLARFEALRDRLTA